MRVTYWMRDCLLRTRSASVRHYAIAWLTRMAMRFQTDYTKSEELDIRRVVVLDTQ